MIDSYEFLASWRSSPTAMINTTQKTWLSFFCFDLIWSIRSDVTETFSFSRYICMLCWIGVWCLVCLCWQQQTTTMRAVIAVVLLAVAASALSWSNLEQPAGMLLCFASVCAPMFVCFCFISLPSSSFSSSIFSSLFSFRVSLSALLLLLFWLPFVRCFFPFSSLFHTLRFMDDQIDRRKRQTLLPPQWWVEHVKMIAIEKGGVSTLFIPSASLADSYKEAPTGYDESYLRLSFHCIQLGQSNWEEGKGRMMGRSVDIATYQIPHEPHTVTTGGPPSQPVPSWGDGSGPHHFMSPSLWRNNRMYPDSPQNDPQLFHFIPFHIIYRSFHPSLCTTGNCNKKRTKVAK